MVLYWPGRRPTCIEYLTSHLDIAPTLLKDLLDCQNDAADFSNGTSLFDPSPRVRLVSASWDQIALHSPGRIDVLYTYGPPEHFDEDYNEIQAPIPIGLVQKAVEGMTRFYRR